MLNKIIHITLLLGLISCTNPPPKSVEKTLTEKISIFEVYFKDPKVVDQFSLFVSDTLKLPVEWAPFDIFGNGVVYDAAYYLGNTTLELLALSKGDSSMHKEAKYNRILFEAKDIGRTHTFLNQNAIQHTDPFDFNIVSDSSELTIGKQINLDSLSLWSNINIAFWQYVDAGYHFKERTIIGKTFQELEPKLKTELADNPMGIIDLKEVHLSIDERSVAEWNKLLGLAKDNHWILEKGPKISYSIVSNSIGADWISIRVKDLKTAENFLLEINLSSTIQNGQILIDKSKVYGLNFYFEE